MVPAAKILDTAVAEGADVVGLSGLITPSLDEMVAVAAEMQRRGLKLPLLIGGATTSRQHTAVRIAPAYEHTTVHVLDASRVVGVVSDLLDDDRAEELAVSNRAEQERLREQHANKQRKPLLTVEAGAGQPGAGRLRRAAGAGVHRAAAGVARPGDAARDDRLAVPVPGLGAEGQVPGDPGAAGRAGAVRRREHAARPDHRRRVVHRRRRLRVLAGAQRGRRHPARRPGCLVPDAAPADREAGGAREPLPGRLHRAGGGPPGRVRRGDPRRGGAGRAVRGRATTTTGRSW